MPTVVIQDTKSGLDARNMPESTLAGALIRADNCVINQGGEAEKLEAWRRIFSLPANATFGMETVNDIIHVFGSAVAPATLPQKVTYVRLQPASGANMTGIIDTELFDGKIYAIATFDDGKIVHFYDGTEITDFEDGGAVSEFEITAGSSGNVERVVVNLGTKEVDLVTGAVAYNTSLRQTAKDVAQHINNTKTIPNFRATSLDARVIVTVDESGTAGNAYTLRTVVTGLVTNAASPVSFANGAALSAGKFQAGTYAKTAAAKMNILSKSILHFSAIDDAEDFDPAPPVGTGAGVGAGFINISNHARGNEELIAISEYFDKYAIFGKDTIQIWNLDPDEDLNARIQTIPQTGTIAAGSVTPFGVDTAYLDRTGVRSLRSRDSSRSANINDIGTAIDPIIQDRIINSSAEAHRAQATIDPLTGRYFLSIGKEIFIFSYFPGNKVSGWTRSLPGYEVDKFVQRQLRITARSGDYIYQLSGSQNAEGFCGTNRYGTASGVDTISYNDPDVGFSDDNGNIINRQADIITPYIDGGDPSRFKILKGIDLVIEGQWQVFLLTDPRDITKQTEVCKIQNSSLKLGRIAMNAHTTHFSIRLISIGTGFARVSKILMHYDLGEQE